MDGEQEAPKFYESLGENQKIGVDQIIAKHPELAGQRELFAEYAALHPDNTLKSKNYITRTTDGTYTSYTPDLPSGVTESMVLGRSEEPNDVFPEVLAITPHIKREAEGFKPFLQIAKTRALGRKPEWGYRDYWNDILHPHTPQVSHALEQFSITQLAEYAEILKHQDFEAFLKSVLYFYDRAGLTEAEDASVIDYCIRHRLPLLPKLHRGYKAAENKEEFIEGVVAQAKHHAENMGFSYDSDPELAIADFVINRVDSPQVEHPARNLDEIRAGGFAYHLTSRKLWEQMQRKDGLQPAIATEVVATTTRKQPTNPWKIYLGSDLQICLANSGAVVGRTEEMSGDLILLKVKITNPNTLTVDEDWTRLSTVFIDLAHRYKVGEISETDIHQEVNKVFGAGLGRDITDENYHYLIDHILTGDIQPLSLEQGLRVKQTFAVNNAAGLQVIEAIPFSMDLLEQELVGGHYLIRGWWRETRGDGVRKLIEEQETVKEYPHLNQAESPRKESLETLAETITKIRAELDPENLPDPTTFVKPNEEWFARAEESDGLHRIGHETRVEFLSDLIGRLLKTRENINTDREVMHWFAAVHDTQRLDDSVDRDHGDRAGTYFLAQADTIGAQDLTDHQRRFVEFLCRAHEADDSRIADKFPETDIIKDADGLERVRIADLDPNYLRLDISKELITLATALFDQSQRNYARGMEPFAAVIEAAKTLGLTKNSSFPPENIDLSQYDGVDITTPKLKPKEPEKIVITEEDVKES